MTVLPAVSVAVTVKALVPDDLVSIGWPFATVPVHVAIGAVGSPLQLNRASFRENSPCKLPGWGETILTEGPDDCKALLVLVFGETAPAVAAETQTSKNPEASAASHRMRSPGGGKVARAAIEIMDRDKRQ